MANPFRAEADLKTPQQVYTLRLNMNDLAVLQRELGVGIYELVERIGERKFGVIELAAVMRRALRTGGTQFTNQRAGEVVAKIMEQAGLPACTTAVLDLLLASLADPTEIPQEKEATPAPASSDLFPSEGTDSPL